MTHRKKERGPVRIEWLQVPDDVVLVRSKTLAALLSAAFGKRVSHGDALLHIVKLWMWVVAQVNEVSDDLHAEFRRCGVLERAKAEVVLADALGVAAKHGAALVDALADPNVRVLGLIDYGEGHYVEVLGVEERYTHLARRQGESRGRARVSRLGREAGWKALQGGRWEHAATGETVDDWRSLEIRLTKETP